MAMLASACTEVPPPPDSSDTWRDAGGTGVDAGCSPVDFVAAMADPLAPAIRLPGRAFLSSSRSPEPQAGMHNDDATHFLRFEDGRVTLADENGPGVITRLWFTLGPPHDVRVDDVPLRLTIDGHVVIMDVPLGELASGAASPFPDPWSNDPSMSSGGLVISSPIAFQSHARVELTITAGTWVYYQVDVRRLPSDVCVHSFEGRYSADETTALASAATVWRDHVHPGVDTVTGPLDLAPGVSTELSIDGPGALTTVELITPPATRAEVSLRIEVDGEVAADAPLAWLTGSGFPAGEYAAALTASSATSATLYAPIPFVRRVRMTVTNHATAPVSVSLRARAVTMPTIPADVGRLHAECGTSVASIPVPTEEPPYPDTFPNVILAEATRGPGQFAGITMFQTAPNPWWWALEPDHEVAIDGSYDILGTGTEDYFGGGFYFMNGPYASVTSGASGFMRPDGTVMPIPDAHTHLYRHHLVDTWPFDHELRFEMESYVDGTRFDGCMFVYLF